MTSIQNPTNNLFTEISRQVAILDEDCGGNLPSTDSALIEIERLVEEGKWAAREMVNKAALLEHRLVGHDISHAGGLIDFALLEIDKAQSALSLLSLACSSVDKIDTKMLIPLIAAMEHDLMGAQSAIEVSQTGEKPLKTENPE